MQIANLIVAAWLIIMIPLSHCKAGPSLGPTELIQSLDLTLPELAKISKLASEQQWQEACEAYGNYIKQRKTPTYLNAQPFPPVALIPKPNTEWADRIANNEFYFSSNWYDLGKSIDWTSNPTSGATATLEWNASLNRHGNLSWLVDAYRSTAEESYAGNALRLLGDWIHKSSFPLTHAGINPYDPYWEILNVAIRIGEYWPSMMFRMLSSPKLTNATMCEWIRSWRENALQLARYPTSGGNWLSFEMKSLFTAGSLYPEMKDASQWRKMALENFLWQTEHDFYPDGISTELAHGYGTSQVLSIADTLELAKLNHQMSDVPKSLKPKLEAMFDYILLTMKPDGWMPNFNDSSETETSWLHAKASTFFPDRLEFKWGATKGKEGEKPKLTSVAFPYAGHYVMRSDWTSGAKYLFFDGGLFGRNRGHGHEDKLHFILSAFGRDLLLDPGNWFPYDESKWRKYVVSSRGHNTILVNDQGQDSRHNPSAWVQPFPFHPLKNQWMNQDRYDFVEATFNDGYYEGVKVKHTRSILFVKPNYWIVRDVLDPEISDSKDYQYNALFHLNADSAAINSETKAALTNNPDANLLLWPTGENLTTELIKGKEAEPVQGWAHHHNIFKAIPTYEVKFGGKGRQQIVTLLHPYASGEGISISQMKQIEVYDELGRRSDEGRAVQLTYANGDMDYILLADINVKTLTFAGFVCQKTLCWKRVRDNKVIDRF